MATHNFTTTGKLVTSTFSTRITPTWRACIPPHCRSPDKRDFMDFSPEQSEADFYRNYDPMVGIGTALILLAFIFFITVKSVVRYSVRHFQKARYRKKFFAAAAAAAAVAAAESKMEEQNKIINDKIASFKSIHPYQKRKEAARSNSIAATLSRYNAATKLKIAAGRLSLGSGARYPSSPHCSSRNKNEKFIAHMMPISQDENDLEEDENIDQIQRLSLV